MVKNWEKLKISPFFDFLTGLIFKTIICPRLGPIEPNFMQMGLQSPHLMDLERNKHVAWAKLANPTINTKFN